MQLDMMPALLKCIAAAGERESELVALCADVPADPRGRWSAKDHLAHLAWWRSRSARLVDGVRTGGELPPSVDDDTQNAEIYSSHRDQRAAEVVAEAKQSWDGLAAAVAACSEDDLKLPHPYAPGYPIWSTIAANAHGHLAEHLMFWHLEAGDPERAEAAQRWLYDLELGSFPTERGEATASYNLACFYIRVARDDEAVRLLRRAFQLRPELVEQARKDSELDRIRDHADLAAELA